ncbi:MAG: diaminopimelate epimerase [Acidimicrobiaceae bacterium]|nr:diaminopimelate epimerase [Acidimicrobiaceae bacterium]
MVIALTKYEALGNDFLVLVDPERALRYDAELAVALCDRHLGVGADGLLRVSRPESGADLAMELRNADGGVAETSGNGLRCAVLAALHAGLLSGREWTVSTVAGVVDARLLSGGEGPEAEIRVGMGVLAVTVQVSSPLPGRKAFSVDAGNPHLVLVGDDLGGVDLSVTGPLLEASRPGGVNVELVAVGPDPEACTMEVWERGAGLTQACGSGSCAAGAALRFAGLAGDRVVVTNPGGPLTVELSGSLEAPRAKLSGPARRVARVEVELADLPVVHELSGSRR